MKVAVAHRTDQPLVVEELATPAIGERDVLVRVSASAICHTDLFAIDALEPGANAFVPGHEACGVVEAVGAEVRRVGVGDRVLTFVVPACGQCWWCVNGMTHRCERQQQIEAAQRFTLPDGSPVTAMAGCGAFAEAMVVDEASVLAVDTDLPDAQLALFGCGVTSGMGAVLNTARVTPGSSVAVIGCGGVGQAAIQAARIAGATTIIAIDPSAARRATSAELGASHAIDPAEADPVEQVQALTDGRGADFTFEVVGRPELMVQAFDMARFEGSVTLVGLPSAAAELTLPAIMALASGRTIKGSVFGSTQVLRDIPRFLRMAETGQLDLAALVSKEIRLDEINEGIELLRNAEGLRTVIV